MYIIYVRKFVLVLLFSFLTACGSTHVVNGGAIQHNGKDTYWLQEDFPLLVLLDDQVSAEAILATYMAIDYWNSVTDLNLFVVQKQDFSMPLPRDYGVITVTVKELGQGRKYTINGLHIARYHDGTAHKRVVTLFLDDDMDDLMRMTVVMAHEFGHALTLDHDPDDPRSLMHPYASSKGDLLGVNIFAMPDDIMWIRAMYDENAERMDMYDRLEVHRGPVLLK